MAKELDLESQEQIQALQNFWDKYGTLITVLMVLAAAAFFGRNYYQKYQREQAAQASVLFGQMQVAQEANDADKVKRVLTDIKERYSGTTYAQQASLLAAQSLAQDKNWEEAKAALQWVADESNNPGYVAMAKLRLSAIAIEEDQLDTAIALVNSEYPAAFAALAADRKGDILSLQNKKPEAIVAYQAAYKGLDENTSYRNLIEAKLVDLGAAVPDAAEAIAPIEESTDAQQ